MGLYYKNHRISGVNFLPRLTLSEYNNLTVKPEHWIRTDSPFDYSKTDVPKLTLAQYQDLAIKPKFWIRTDAPQSYTTISATQVDVTDSVSVKDYLDNLDATQVAYEGNISVKEKIDWTLLGNFKFADSGTSFEGDWNLTNDVPASCNEICFYVTVGGGDVGYMPRNSMVIPYSVFSTYKVFYDFNIGTSRVYLQVERVSDSKFKISNVTLGGLSSPMNIYAYAR